MTFRGRNVFLPFAASVLTFSVVTVGWAQKGVPDSARPKKLMPAVARNGARHSSGPLVWIESDNNPKTVFWIQGKFVPIGEAHAQGDAEVATILCSVREYQCLEIDSTASSVGYTSAQAWIEEYKPVSWNSHGILATARSLDGCTDETLKIQFSPPSVILINSPVLPMSGGCRRINNAWDKVLGKKGGGIAAQMEQDKLVPTRGIFSFQDVDSDQRKAPEPVQRKNP